jgi:hypothetical protein
MTTQQVLDRHLIAFLACDIEASQRSRDEEIARVMVVTCRCRFRHRSELAIRGSSDSDERRRRMV